MYRLMSQSLPLLIPYFRVMRRISYFAWSVSLAGGFAIIPVWLGEVERKYLREYRCPTCNRLLSKGFLKDKDSYLEVMCRICKTVQTFTGEDAEIIQVRHDLIKEGIITGHELSEEQQRQE